MIEFFLHFGVSIAALIVDCLVCAFLSFMWSEGNRILYDDDFFMVLAIVNTLAFAISVSFLVL